MTTSAAAGYGSEMFAMLGTLSRSVSMKKTVMLAPALALMLTTTSCRMSTVQDASAAGRPYLLAAYAVGSDSVGSTFCQVAALLPEHLSVRDRWSDTVPVYVTRSRPTGGVQVDTAVTQMIVELTQDPNDSLHVSIRGAFRLDLSGKPTNSVEASGRWKCDDGVPLSQRLSGAPQGTWILIPDRYSGT